MTPCKGLEVFLFRSAPSDYRCFESLEMAEEDIGFVDVNPSTPALLFRAPSDTAMPRFVVGAKPTVLSILNRSGETKVHPFVVGAIPISVVYLSSWPTTIHVEPSEPMLKIYLVIDANLSVLVTNASRPIPGFDFSIPID